MAWHLAQLNVGRLRAPLDDPMIAEFVANLDAVNHLAEESPGFVWRLQTDDGDATAVRAFDDELVIVNLTVWTGVDMLAEFVYRTGHVSFLRRKKEWFDKMVEAHLVLWWLPADELPTVEQAVDRLAALRRLGPSPDGFTFRSPFPPPGGDGASVVDERNACPA